MKYEIIDLVIILRPPYLPILPLSKDAADEPYLAFYAIIGVLVLILYGIVGSIDIMSDPLNSLYFTVQTIATVGFGDIQPITPIQKIFTITLVMGGVALLRLRIYTNNYGGNDDCGTNCIRCQTTKDDSYI